MVVHLHNKYIIFEIIILLLSLSLTSSIMSKPEVQHHYITDFSDGVILFSPMISTLTYLIDYDGKIVHTWPNNNQPGYSVYPLENDSILRAARHNFKIGGMVQEIAWNGDIVWEFIYDSDEHLSHHDVKSLPNGNVLLIAWEDKTRAEAIAAGRNPDYVSSKGLMPDHVIEVQPNGPTSDDCLGVACVGSSYTGL